METSGWLSKLDDQLFQLKVWRSTAIISLIATIAMSISTLLLASKVFNDFRNERLILVPAIQRKIVVPAKSNVSESFVKAAAKRVVELQEQWSYETVQDHFNEVFNLYYSHGLSELTRANLMATNRYNYIEKNKMVSTFHFDNKRSEFSWCEKLNRACAIVVGTRKIYINHNEPYSKKEVAYFLLAETIWPTDEHPHALKFSRVKIDDTTGKAFENIKRQFDAAKQGVLPDEI
jgi:hypothetical protein